MHYNIIGSKSRLSIKTVPVNESLSTPLSISFLTQAAKAFKPHWDLNEKADMLFLGSGDSKIILFYYNPRRRIPCPLNRNSVLSTISFFNELISIYPKAKCALNWVEGSLNSAEIVSKYNGCPIRQANSTFFRHSAMHNKELAYIMTNVFFELSKEKCNYMPLPLTEEDKTKLIKTDSYTDKGLTKKDKSDKAKTILSQH